MSDMRRREFITLLGGRARSKVMIQSALDFYLLVHPRMLTTGRLLRRFNKVCAALV
jgi:hypothetical protein